MVKLAETAAGSDLSMFGMVKGTSPLLDAIRMLG